jgi:hypothetical protein
MESIIPRGIFLVGFFTSPDMLAIFKSPPNDIKTNPEVTKTLLKPFGIKGVKLTPETFPAPPMIKKSIIAKRATTSITSNFAASLTPAMLRITKNRQIKKEEIKTGNPKVKYSISAIPKTAKADFKHKAAQLKKEDAVPTSGPRLLVIKK